MLKSALKPILVAGALALALAANAQQKPAAPAAKPAAPPAKAPAKLTAEQALLQAVKADPDLAAQEKTFKTAEAALKKKPKDAKAQKAYVDACYAYGHKATNEGSKAPKILYRAALALFRRALKVDPKHQPSIADKDQIEAIYKTMGGIPQ